MYFGCDKKQLQIDSDFVYKISQKDMKINKLEMELKELIEKKI